MKKFITYLTTAVITLLLPLHDAYPQGYTIYASIKGTADTSLILSYRYGSKFYSLDTARTDAASLAVFSDNGNLERGMYQIILPDKSFVDFFIDDSQEISIETDINNLVGSLSSPDSKCNQSFFDWQRENQDLRKKANDLQKKIETSAPGSAEQTGYQKELELLRKQNEDLWDDTIDELGDALPGKFLRGMRPFEVPEEYSKDKDGKPDQMMQYNYYLNHFFDNIDFKDPALLRTPLVFSKLNQFFSRVVPLQPDSVIKYVDKVIGLAEAEPEVFQFTVQHLLNYYSEPKIMGMDAVYVHIGEKYYLNGKADWISDTNLKIISERIKAVKPLLIGAPAPELPGLETPDGVGIDIKDFESDFLLIYFWEPECSHCKTATPKLMELYKKIKDSNVGILAINTRLDKDVWEDFIAEHELTWTNVYSPHNIREILTGWDAYSTPKLFILDSEKKIAAKDISVDQVAQVLEHLRMK